ncbi:AP-3 complex subunit beta-2-like [Schistocerca gregaria]|uniref:AP-3 complex subunit beta-2-like n=1 Tax=Schistocerca gregaria TaxID=7010 RepID=UPI00211E0F7D|nr:AP-3 complex subunit beta-2-like [Schistocerca gregaria]
MAGTLLGEANYFQRKIRLDVIKQLIESPQSSESKITEGLKQLLVGISRGEHVSKIYPSVAKLSAHRNQEIKKMVYIYLTHYAELEPEAALLPISILKKDLSNVNQLVRATALRNLSSIRVKSIVHLTALAIKKASLDTSPYVRKVAAHSTIKVVSLDLAQEPMMLEVIEHLLKDKNNAVLGGAIAAFSVLCPNHWAFLHKNFRRICHELSSIDEWGQISALAVLTRYARAHFLDPSEDGQETKRSHKKTNDATLLDPDYLLLLNSALPLLRSLNSAVVLAAATLCYYLLPEFPSHAAKALIHTMHTNAHSTLTILNNIQVFASHQPEPFLPFIDEFCPSLWDSTPIQIQKIQIFALLVNERNFLQSIRRFKYYLAHYSSEPFLQVIIASIGQIALKNPSFTDICLQFLISLILDENKLITSYAVIAIKQILQRLIDSSQEYSQTQSDYTRITQYLAKVLDTINSPEARISVLWILANYTDHILHMSHLVLTKLAKIFVQETVPSKLQILNLTSKIYLLKPDETKLIFQYLLDLAKYDVNYDLRDKERLLRNLCFSSVPHPPVSQQRLLALLLSKKPASNPASPVSDDEPNQSFYIGYISFILGPNVDGCFTIPPWTKNKSSSESRCLTTSPPVASHNQGLSAIQSPSPSSYAPASNPQRADQSPSPRNSQPVVNSNFEQQFWDDLDEQASSTTGSDTESSTDSNA